MGALIAPATRRGDPSQAGLANAAFTITFARLPIGVGMLFCLMTGRSFAGGVTLALFVGLDIMDGVVARAGNNDDAYRRGLDCIVDRLIVVAFFLGAAVRVHGFLTAATIITIINMIALPFAVATWHRHRLVLKAPRWHHSWALLLFAAGLLYFTDRIGDAVFMAICGAICISICTGSLIYAHATLGKIKK